MLSAADDCVSSWWNWAFIVDLICCCSVAKSCLTLCNPVDYIQHASLLYPSLSPRVCSNSCALSWWCHPAISSSVIPFSSCPQSFPASGSFPVSRLFTSGGQSIGASASVSVLPMSIPGCFPLGLTGLMSLLSKGLSSWWVLWFSWNLLCGYLKITKLTSYTLGLF